MKSMAKKPGLMLAIGLGKSKAPESSAPGEEETDGEEESSDLDSAAQGVIDAVNSSDAEALKSALKLFVLSCKSEEC